MVMTYYYLDTSALIKRYLTEKGTSWIIRKVFAPNTYLAVARITHAEVASTFARRVRGKMLTPADEIRLMRLFERYLKRRFVVMEIDAAVCSRAASLARTHGLRGYDSVQLACALRANSLLLSVKISDLTFLTADAELLKAGAAEGLATDNPENY